ncbi:MAG: c-type cytochrome [Solirubrobacterales bacterium]|nr:c-type cytochrome [Solirubrobacterales bacterium]
MTSSLKSTKLPLVLAMLGLTAAAIAGCGTSDPAPISGDFNDRGRQLFTAKCGTCHKMAQAASTGTQGPDLDAAFAAAREVGMDEETIRSIVHNQVLHPRPPEEGFPGVNMPADIVTGNDLDDVAAYVARYAGVPGAAPPKAPGEGPGAQVYAENGCGSCHTLAAANSAGVLGPNLDEVIPGMSKAEIKTSIVDPNASKAKGYENVAMPDSFDSIPADQLNQLIDFLVTSAAADNSGG